jgi:hypothetical protein
VDALQPVEQNYAEVLRFVTSPEVALEPLDDVLWSAGKYH